MSTVIRASETASATRRPRPFELVDYVQQARDLMVDSQSRANSLLADAGKKIRSLEAEAAKSGYSKGEEEGRRAGYEAGLKEGFQKAHEEAQARFTAEQQQVLNTLVDALEGFGETKDALIRDAKRDMLEFVIAIAGKVTRKLASLDSTAASANLEEALRLTGVRTDITIRIHPADVVCLNEFMQEPHGGLRSKGHVTVMEDGSIARGGCVVTTAAGRVDARLETQLEEIVNLLMGDELRSTSVDETTGPDESDDDGGFK